MFDKRLNKWRITVLNIQLVMPNIKYGNNRSFKTFLWFLWNVIDLWTSWNFFVQPQSCSQFYQRYHDNVIVLWNFSLYLNYLFTLVLWENINCFNPVLKVNLHGTLPFKYIVWTCLIQFAIYKYFYYRRENVRQEYVYTNGRHKSVFRMSRLYRN